MFTGLVEDLGEIIQVEGGTAGFSMVIASHFDLDFPDIGSSIAVDGVCLTVVGINKNRFTVDISPETLKKTTLQWKKKGDQVNLERALQVSDRLGGHLVTGHIDGIGTINSIEIKGNSLIFSITVPPEISKYLITKGSVGVDGVSLTVNEVKENHFSVNIIPHTARVTTLGRKKIGDKVNIETDLIGKYVEKFLREAGIISVKKEGGTSSLDYNFLSKHGFI